MIETPVFATAAVAAPHRLAATTGRDVLAEGGNAIEAMVAMAATIAVVYPHMNGIGGDGFWLIREFGGRVHSIHAAGPAGRLATRRFYADRGYDTIPVRGPHAALTVPGAIGGWQLALRIAQSLGGKLPLSVLTADAVRLAREGYPVSASEARSAPKEVAELRQSPGFAETFLVEGKPPAVGTQRRAEPLSATLSYLTQAGLEDFYRGDVAREIAADAAPLGCLIARDDLQSFEAVVVLPLQLALDGRTLFNTAPPSQGLASLLLLGMFDRLKVSRAESFEHIHGLIEATKRAVAIRDRICTDSSRLPQDPRDFLQPRAIAAEAAQIDMSRAAVLPLHPAEGGTIWMGAIDGAGLAVSYIQSIYWEYGSGCVLPRTGILLQNRGISFSLDPAALNSLEPGLRPYHTLNAPMSVFADGRVMPYGSMGGDGQPQFQAQIFTRMMLGAGLAEAIDRPRFVYGRAWGETSSSVKVESRFEPSIATALERAGHEIERIEAPYHEMFGHAGMLLRHPSGTIEAAHDPRADGGASGL
jgi:gamma-glutamyltranspeptidase/glutathione hydrolase